MSSSKTEKPTQKKLKDSAEKGQSFKSKDFIIACLMFVGVSYLINIDSLTEFMSVYQSMMVGDFNADMHGYVTRLMLLALKFIAPIFLICIVAASLPSLLQTGFVLAAKALKLNLGAINPAKGIKKIFSLRTVKDTVKSLLYLVSFIMAIWISWQQNKRIIFQQLYGSPQDMAAIWKELLFSTVLISLGCIFIVLILDALAEYFLYIKDLKMDKQEVKREVKDQEGNPEIKAKRNEVRMEILSDQVISDIDKSTLIIANPTHITIGIYYNPDIVPIPFISVYETNQRALAVRKHAEKKGIPVITDIQLARRIYKTHSRYSFIKLDEVDQILALISWLEQVENVWRTEQK